MINTTSVWEVVLSPKVKMRIAASAEMHLLEVCIDAEYKFGDFNNVTSGVTLLHYGQFSIPTGVIIGIWPPARCYYWGVIFAGPPSAAK